MPRLPLLLAAAACAASAPAQSLDDLRQQLREDLRQVHFASGFLSLIALADDLELSSARYSFDNESSSDLSTLALPFHLRLSPWDSDSAGLYLEGVAGYASADEGTADIYSGQVPALATSVDAEWRTFGGMLGAGLDLQPVDGLHLVPIVDLGLAWMQNRTDYGGPGAAFAQALFDGIAFNWDALALTYGGALRVDWLAGLGRGHRLECVGRYDLRWTDTLREDDPAQAIEERMQVATLRADVTGPTGLEPFGQALGWRATVGYRWFLEGDLFGVDGYLQVGGGLELMTGDHLPVGRGLALSGAAILAHDMTGWSIGLSLLF